MYAGSLPNDMNGSQTQAFLGEAVQQKKMKELELIPSSPEEIPQDDLSAGYVVANKDLFR